MKKIILFTLVFGLSLMWWNPAMAKKEKGALSAPSNVTAVSNPETICFSWQPVDGAHKYSLDVAVDVDLDRDSLTDKVVEFSFGTGDRTDGFDPSEPKLCVPLSDFVFDLDGDGVLDQVSGPAYIKVKALNPGKGRKGNGRQNNAFSAEIKYTLGGSSSLPDPVMPPESDPLPPQESLPYPDPLEPQESLAYPDPLAQF